MSLFAFECLKCGELQGFMGEPSVLKEFICSKCKSRHEQIGRIWGLHSCHSHPIWQLEGTDKLSISHMPVSLTILGAKVRLEWTTTDKKRIREYKVKLGLIKKKARR